MAIKDKLLFQVELIPPSAGNVKKVSQVLDQNTKAQRRNTQAQEEASQQTSQTEKRLEQYDKQLRKLNQSIRQTEEGARFYGASTEEATQALRQQETEALNLREQISRLEQEVEESNVSWKKHARLVNRANSVVKKTNLAQDKVQTGFRSMSSSASQANQVLMDFGRIVQDAPFGIIGISNNLDPAAQSMRRFANSSDGAGDMVSTLMSKLIGTGGLIFLLGSALPTVATLASQGMIGFGDDTEESGDKVEDFSGELATVIDNMAELRTIQGDDPLGIQSAEGRLRAVKTMNEQLETVRQKQERIQSLEKSSTMMSMRGVELYEDEIEKLETQIEKVKERTGLSDEQIKKLQKQEGSLEAQIEELEKMNELDPVQVFELKNLNRANELISRQELGITRVQEARERGLSLTAQTSSELRSQRSQLESRLETTRQWLMTNERDTKEWETKRSELRKGLDILDQYNDAIDTSYGGAQDFLDTFEKGIIPATVEANENGFMEVTESLRENKAEVEGIVEGLQNWVKTHDEGNVAWERKNEKLEDALALVEKYDTKLGEITPPTVTPEKPEDEILNIGLDFKVDFETDEAEVSKLTEEQAKFTESARERTFEIRSELASDLLSLEMSTMRQINQVEERALELGLQNTQTVEELKTAIKRREAKKRREIEMKHEKELQEGRMAIVEQSSSFIQSVNSSLAEESKTLALIRLAIDKGLKIAQVANETSRRVNEMRQTAQEATLKAQMASADSVSAFASGNVLSGTMHAQSATQYSSVAGQASAQAGSIAGQGAATIGLISATTLAEAGNILSGGGGSGGGAGATGGGGASAPSMTQGFQTDEREGRGEDRESEAERRRRNRSIAEDSRMDQDSGDTIIYLQGDMSDSRLFKRVQAGKKQASQDSVVVRSD